MEAFSIDVDVDLLLRSSASSKSIKRWIEEKTESKRKIHTSGC